MSGTSLPETAPMRLTPPRMTTASNMKMTAAVSFGEMPKAVYNLLYVAYLKSLAHHAYMTDVKQKGEKVSFEMKPDAAVDVEKIPAILEEYKRELSFQAGKNPTFVLDLSKTKKVKQLEKIEHCVNSLNSLIIR